MSSRLGALAVGALVLAGAGSAAGIAAAGVPVIDLGPDLEAVRAESSFPALAAAVIVNGELRALGVVGVRKQGLEVRAEEGDPFHLGSCTKAMTGTLIGLLVQQGRLKWETPIGEYLPALKDRMHPDYRPVTLVHLLSHRAGVASMTEGFAPIRARELREIVAVKSPSAQRRRMTEIVLSQPPIHRPGDKYEYSNAGFAIAGAVVETVMGEDYEVLLRRLVFEPLGMRSAGFGAMGAPDRVDAPWQHRREGERLIPVNPGPASDNPPFLAPAGRVHCSMADWARYIQSVLKAARGEPGRLPPGQLDSLKTPPFGGDYALGWALAERGWGGGGVLTHAGSNGMNFCVAWVAPAKNFAVLVAVNRGGEGAAEGADRVCAAMIGKFLADR